MIEAGKRAFDKARLGFEAGCFLGGIFFDRNSSSGEPIGQWTAKHCQYLLPPKLQISHPCTFLGEPIPGSLYVFKVRLGNSDRAEAQSKSDGQQNGDDRFVVAISAQARKIT